MSIRHLKTRKQFQSMLAHPPVARTSHFCLHRLPVRDLLSTTEDSTLLWTPPSDCENTCEAQWWVGALLPKRWAKRAVTRNLIRRHVYALTLELSRSMPHAQASASNAEACNGLDAGSSINMPATFPSEPQALLIRLRASFHASKAENQRKRKGASKTSTSRPLKKAGALDVPAAAEPVALTSASSALLASRVRAQLLTLFERAATVQAPSTPHSAHPPLRPQGEGA